MTSELTLQNDLDRRRNFDKVRSREDNDKFFFFFFFSPSLLLVVSLHSSHTNLAIEIDRPNREYITEDGIRVSYPC